MRPDPTPPSDELGTSAFAATRGLAVMAGGVPGGTAWALAANASRSLRRFAAGSLMLAAAVFAAASALSPGEPRAARVVDGAWVAAARAGHSAGRLAAPAAVAAEKVAVLASLPPPPAAALLDAALPKPAAPPVAADSGRAAGPALRGDASYYASQFEGRRTASGETYRGGAMTAAHRTLPFGTRVRVTNPRNGRSVVVKINDRGPFHPRRIIDVSRTAAIELGILRRGRDAVVLEVLGRT